MGLRASFAALQEMLDSSFHTFDREWRSAFPKSTPAPWPIDRYETLRAARAGRGQNSRTRTTGPGRLDQVGRTPYAAARPLFRANPTRLQVCQATTPVSSQSAAMRPRRTQPMV